MRTLILIFVAMLCAMVMRSQDSLQVRNDQLQISLLTCDAGDGIEMLFGHSAIRVQDGVNDIVYNYGTFNFNTPGFVLKFMRGKLPYTLSINTIERFLGTYHYEKRSVREQVFLLSSSEKEAVLAFLQENAKPENREYKYDFFFDNCSTRIADLLKENVEGVEFPTYKNSVTFRDMLHEFLAGSPWYEYGIDLIIGAKADRLANVRDQMFLPLYLQDHLANSTAQKKPLVTASNPIFTFEEEHKARLVPTKFTPSLMFVVLIVLWALLFFTKRNKALIVLNKSIFSIVALMSLVIIFLWFFTDHSATKINLNLIWISPLAVLLIDRTRKWTLLVIHTMIILTVVGLLGMLSGVIPQYHPSPLMALFMLLVLGIHLVLIRNKSNVAHTS